MSIAPPHLLQPTPSSSSVAGNASGLLTVVGICLILGGLGCGTAVIGYTFALPMLIQSVPTGGGSVPGPADGLDAMQETMRPVMILNSITYGAVALGVAWLGIGSIRARRWAWKIALALGWLWVAVIILSVISYSFIFPKLMNSFSVPASPGAPTLSGPVLTAIMIVSAGIGLMFYLSPGVMLIVVYGLRNVRLTCERQDPNPCWTDRVPIPVLSFWLLLMFSLFTLLEFSPVYLGFIKAPGISGLLPRPAVVLVCLTAALPALGLACWDLASMRIRGWWISLFLCLAGCASLIWNGFNLDLVSLNRELNMPEEDLKLLESLGKGALLLPTIFISIPILGYVIWLKRFFQRPAQS